MGQPGRAYVESGTGNYRYGFNGKENDNEVKGIGDEVDYGMRAYDPRVGRFLSVDPLYPAYPWYTPYQFAGNNPVAFVDLDGLEPSPAGKPAEKKPDEANKNVDVNPLPTAVVVGHKRLSKTATDRVKIDARAAVEAQMRLYLPGMQEAKEKEITQFALREEAENLKEMLFLARYQRPRITLVGAAIDKLADDDNFGIYEQNALQALENGAPEYTKVVAFGGERGSLLGLIIPLPSSLKTWRVTLDELTWMVRHATVKSHVLSSTDRTILVQYELFDQFDLSAQGGRSGSYNVISRSLGYIHHTLLQNSAPQVYATWTILYTK